MEVQPDPAGLNRLCVTAPEYNASFEVYGQAPVQALGSVLGRDLYFRARHDGWSFDVADRGGNLPSDGYRDSDGFFCEGEYPGASWMPLAEAVQIIVRCLREYTGGIGLTKRCSGPRCAGLLNLVVRRGENRGGPSGN